MRAFEKVLIISLVLLISMALNSWAAEEESQPIEKIDVPEAVMKAFTKDFPEMAITGVEIEEIDGVTYYGIESGEGETDAIYLVDGTLYSTEQEISVDDLPQVVMDALNAAYPDGEVEEAEVITRGKEKSYEVVLVMEEEEEDLAYEITVASDGKITSEEQILDEEEDDEAPGDIDVDADEEE